MKELTIEQKAKAYDNVVGKLKQFMAQGVDPLITRADVQDFFPTIKESEDEQIRKALIQNLKERFGTKGTMGGILDMPKVLAWLEKQSQEEEPQVYETRDREIITYSETDGYKVVDKIEPKFKVGDWVVWDNKISCHVDNIYQGRESLMYTITDTNNMTRSYSIKGFDNNAHLWNINDAKDGDVLTWDDSKCIAIFKNIYDEDSFNSYGFVGHCTDKFESRQSYHDIKGAHPANKEQRDLLFQKMKEVGYEWDAENKELKKIKQKIEQKSADKIEPKFKVKYAGSEYNVFEIKELAGVTFYGIEDEPNHIDYVKAENCEIISCYDIKEDGFLYPTKPAVFSEQKTADKIESFDEYEGLTDFERTLADICIGWIGMEIGWKEYIKDNANVLLKIAIEKFNSIQDAPFEQKPAEWSEEDEMFVHGLIKGLTAKRDIHGHTTFSSDCIDITETINWLKSLKDRVQPKQEWSEEDEKEVAILQAYIRNNDWSEQHIDRALGIVDELVNKIKSLRPHKNN